MTMPLPATDLGGKRVGVIGAPSDWLISSGVDYAKAESRLNVKMVDIPALFTMMIAKERTGCPGFQCNLSRISGDELLFAHCTVPLSMARTYTYDTHFKSGIGTADVPACFLLLPAAILRAAILGCAFLFRAVRY